MVSCLAAGKIRDLCKAILEALSAFFKWRIQDLFYEFSLPYKYVFE